VVRRFCAIGLLSFLWYPSFAQVGDTQLPADDPALAKPITFGAPRIPLGELLPVLGHQAAVSLRVTSELADLKAAIFVKEQPTRAVMSGLAKAFELSWRRSGNGYVLYQTEDQLRRQRAMLDLAASRLAEDAKQLAQRNMNTAQEDYPTVASRILDWDLELSRFYLEQPAGWEDREREIREQREQYALTFELENYLMGYVGRQMNAQQWEAFWKGEPIVATPDGGRTGLTLPPETCEWMSYEDELRVIQCWGDEPVPPLALPRTTYKNPRFIMRFNPDDGFVLTLMHEDGKTQPYISSFDLETFVIFADSDDLAKTGWPDYRYAAVLDAIRSDKELAAPLVREPDDLPALEYGSVPFGPALGWMAGHSKLSFIAETSRYWFPVDIEESETVGDALISCASQCMIWREGDIVVLRDREYPVKRPSDIPERIMRPWEEQGARNAGLDLDDWAKFLGQLTPVQQRALRSPNKLSMPESFRLNVNNHDLLWNFALLELWGKLPAGTRGSLRAGGELRTSALTGPQADLFVAALRFADEGLAADALSRPGLLGRMTLTMQEEVEHLYIICRKDRLPLTWQGNADLEGQRRTLAAMPDKDEHDIRDYTKRTVTFTINAPGRSAQSSFEFEVSKPLAQLPAKGPS
jgi:hypothetical protein